MIHRGINGPANYRGECCSLAERQPLDGRAEIIFSCGFEPVVSRTQINLVGVHRENLFFGVMPFDLDRQQRFLDLALGAAIGAIQK